MAPKRNIIRGKNFADPTIKKSKMWLPNLKYQLRNKYPPLVKIPFSCHICPLPLLWHEFDNGLWNFPQSKVSCCLHMYFLWRHHLSHNKSENDQDSDSHILLTYDCWHCFSVSNISVSRALEMTINFHYPTLGCFVFHLPNLLRTQIFFEIVSNLKPFTLRFDKRDDILHLATPM
jgi:hypothetical protein